MVRKRGDIQGLRALAVGLVVADHLGLPGTSGGFIGVDVFFVISGFLITGLLLHEARYTGRISLVAFWARRARRLLPAATAVLLGTLAAAAAFGSVGQVEQARTDAIWASGFATNIDLILGGADYFSADDVSLFQHYWSLAVEEQFYLVWPLLITALAQLRTRRPVMLAVMATVFVASLTWSMQFTPSHLETAYFNTFARGYEFAAGAFLAVLAPRFPRWLQWTLGLVGAAVLAACVTQMTGQMPFPGWHAAIPVLGTLALLASPRGPVSRLLRVWPLRALGTISFSVYLWHWPVIELAPGQLPAGWSQSQINVALVGLILALSALTWLCIERPFQHGQVVGFRGHGALLLWPLTIGAVVAMGLAVTSYAEEAQAQRNEAAASRAVEEPTTGTSLERLQAAVTLARDEAPLPVFDVDAHRGDSWRTDFGCFADSADLTAPECRYGDTDATHVVVVQGDSHAAMWLPAIDALGKRDGFAVVPLIKAGCAPFTVPQTLRGRPFPSCAIFRKWATAEVVRLKPAAVIVGYRGLNETSPRDVRSMDQTWMDGVRHLVERESAAAGEVIVLSDIPTRAEPLDDCAATPGRTLGSCAALVEGTGIDSNPLTEEALQGTSARYVDTVGLVCTAGLCPAAVGQTWTYLDDDHLTASWALEVSDQLGERLALNLTR